MAWQKAQIDERQRGVTVWESMRGLLQAVCTLAVAAHTAAQEVKTLPPVEVVATGPLSGFSIARDLLPYPVQRAGESAIRGSNAGNLTEFMAQNLAGVNVNEVQGSPFQSDVTFRGFRASPLLGTAQGLSVFLDGVRINEGFGDVVNWDMLPEAAIANVTLVPGANPLYGLNTLGGALALTTKSGATHPGLLLEAGVGSAGRRRLDLAYGKQLEDGWHVFIAGTRFEEEGWREASSGRLGNLFARFGRGLGRTRADLAILAGSSTLLGNGLLPDDLYEANRRAVYTHPDQTSNDVRQAVLTVRHALDDEAELSALAYTRKSQRRSVNGDIHPAYAHYVDDCKFGFDTGGAPRDNACPLSRSEGEAVPAAVLNRSRSAQATHGAGLNMTQETDGHTLDLGMMAEYSNADYEQLAQDGVFDAGRGVMVERAAPFRRDAAVFGHAWTLALHVSDTVALDAHTHLTASARYNAAQVSNTLSNTRGMQPRESFDYRKLNPALGVTHKLDGGLRVFGNVSQSTRVPTVIELGCADSLQPCALPTGLQADPFLKQVVSRTVEAGVSQRGTQGSYTVSAYRTMNRDDILFLRAGATQLGYFANFGRTRRQGVDASATRTIGNVMLRVNYSYLDASYQASGSLFAGERTIAVAPGMRIAGLPTHTLKLGMDWTASSAWRLGGDLIAVSSQASQGNEDGLLEDSQAGRPQQAGNARVAGYLLLNLRATFQPTQQLEFFARVNNALNRSYETYGMLAESYFPGGELVRPHGAPGEAEQTRFVAPGASRSLYFGIRYRF